MMKLNSRCRPETIFWCLFFLFAHFHYSLATRSDSPQEIIAHIKELISKPSKNQMAIQKLEQKLLLKGSRENFFEMSRLYETVDNPRFRQWSAIFCIRAANAGHLEGMARLSTYYDQGTGLKKDPKKSLYWLKKAALAGHAESSFLYSQILSKSKTEAKPEKKEAIQERALDALKIAAESGHSEANYKLALQYLKSDKSTRHAEAALILRKLSPKGDPRVRLVQASLFLHGKGVEKDQEKALEILQDLVNEGFAQAQYELGLLYQNGNLLERDSQNALKLFRDSAAGGFQKARYNLAQIYLSQNKEKLAIQELDQACQANISPACVKLGEISLRQERTKEAISYYLKAEELQNPTALHQLGFFHQKGLHGFPKNYAKARAYYNRGAKLGYGPSFYNLGILFETGMGGKQDVKEARELYRKAVKLGVHEAREALKRAETKRGLFWELKKKIKGLFQ